MKRLILLCAALTLGLSLSAQNLLSKAKFQAPAKLITATGSFANVRTAPSTKAAIVTILDNTGERCKAQIDNKTLYAVLDERDGWYKIRGYVDMEGYIKFEGWVSKSVSRESKSQSLGEIPFGQKNEKRSKDKMGDTNSKMFFQTASKRGYILYLTGTYYEDSFGGELWLGKQVGNTLVFSYGTDVSLMNSGDTSGSEDWIDKDNMIVYFLYIDKFKFEDLTDKDLERIFDWGLDQKWPPMLYINSETLNPITTTADLKLFDLQGAVKNVVIESKGINEDSWGAVDLLDFDEKGRLTGYDYYTPGREHMTVSYSNNSSGTVMVQKPYSIQRDSKGRILRLAISDWFGYKWTYKGERPSVRVRKAHGGYDETFTYLSWDETHNVPKSIKAHILHRGDDDNYTLTYTYTKFDDKGNWTERKVTQKGTSVSSWNGRTQTQSLNNQYLERRRITYYE